MKTLQQDEAMLLPELHSHFCDVVSKTIQSNVQKSLKTSLPTNRWLLSLISNYLQDNLGIVCKNKRYGTLLYRKNGDLLKASHFRRLASHFRRLYVILKWHFTYMFNSKQVLTKQLAVSFKLTLYFLNLCIPIIGQHLILPPPFLLPSPWHTHPNVDNIKLPISSNIPPSC